MNLRQLEIFRLVAETKSFSRAAEILFLVQSSISININNLEKELGVTLLDRSRGIVELTEPGQKLLIYARQIMALTESAKNEIQSYAKGSEGSIAFGATHTLSSCLLPPVIASFNKQNPKIKIIIKSASTADIIQMILNREIQFGLIRSTTQNPGIPNIDVKFLNNDRSILVTQRNNPILKNIKELTMEKLSKIPLIVYSKNSASWVNINSAFRNHGLSPKILMELDDISTIKAALHTCQAVVFLPASSVYNDLLGGQLVKINVLNCPPLNRYILLASLKGWEASTAEMNFLNCLSEHLDINLADSFGRSQIKAL